MVGPIEKKPGFPHRSGDVAEPARRSGKLRPDPGCRVWRPWSRSNDVGVAKDRLAARSAVSGSPGQILASLWMHPAHTPLPSSASSVASPADLGAGWGARFCPARPPCPATLAWARFPETDHTSFDAMSPCCRQTSPETGCDGTSSRTLGSNRLPRVPSHSRSDRSPARRAPPRPRSAETHPALVPSEGNGTRGRRSAAWFGHPRRSARR